MEFGPNGTVVRLDCNVDDMTGEEFGFARARLFEEGALEVYCVPVQMKKDRPGIELNVICRPADADRMARAVLLHTSTFGVRRSELRSYALDRRERAVATPFGDVRVKTGAGYGVKKEKIEYEDLAAYALRAGVTLAQAKSAVLRLLQKENLSGTERIDS